MQDNNSPKTVEQLETEIVSLKIRIRRLEDFIRQMPSPVDYVPDPSDEDLVNKAIELVGQYDAVSASLFQRRFSISYARAAKIMDILENKGIVSKSDGTSKPRTVLVKNHE